MFGRYHLLCNACNWEFAGWAIPGTVEAAATRRRKKRAAAKKQQAPETFEESKESVENIEKAEDNIEKVEVNIKTAEDAAENLNRMKVRKRVKVKLKK
jgi:hypothetical protein